MKIHNYEITPSENDLNEGAGMFGESKGKIIEHCKSFVEHINSNEIVSLIKTLLDIAVVNSIIKDTPVCGYDTDQDTGWGKYFPSGQVVAVDVDENSVPYIMVNIRLFCQIPTQKKLISLVHEMVHVEQFRSKRMQKVSGNIFWLGDNWNEEFNRAQQELIVNDNDQLYRKLPWEVEAYYLENKFEEKLAKIA